MKIHELKRNTKRKKAKIIGRGGKRGTYSGRGIKGQLARSGHKLRPELRDIIKKLPKLRGYRFASRQKKPAIVNLEDLEKNYSAGETVSPQTLWERGLVRKTGGRLPKVKILGVGELSKTLLFKDCAISANAKTKWKI